MFAPNNKRQILENSKDKQTLKQQQRKKKSLSLLLDNENPNKQNKTCTVAVKIGKKKIGRQKNK